MGMMIGSGKELLHFFNVTRSPVSTFYVVKLFLKFLRDMAFHGWPMQLMNGNALVARLAKSCFDKQVPIWTRASASELKTDKTGRVIGAIVDTQKGKVKVSASCGVVLAAGGFPQDVVRRKEHFDHAPSGHEHVSPAPPGNTGDGLRLGEAVGATVATELPHSAAWVPISRPVRKDGTLGTFPHFVDRSKPGVIAVTRSGRRFVNKADSYHDFCQAMVKRCTEEGVELCAFFIADHRTLRKYGLGYVKPYPVPFKAQIKSGYLLTGQTLDELAEQIGADADELARTVERANTFAKTGKDTVFGKGTTSYNLSLGDPEHKPNPCFGPIAQAPFYAVKLLVGDLGTFAGLPTDEKARVLAEDGKPIQGLYSAGNDAMSIMGAITRVAASRLGPHSPLATSPEGTWRAPTNSSLICGTRGESCVFAAKNDLESSVLCSGLVTGRPHV